MEGLQKGGFGGRGCQGMEEGSGEEGGGYKRGFGRGGGGAGMGCHGLMCSLCEENVRENITGPWSRATRIGLGMAGFGGRRCQGIKEGSGGGGGVRV